VYGVDEWTGGRWWVIGVLEEGKRRVTVTWIQGDVRGRRGRRVRRVWDGGSGPCGVLGSVPGGRDLVREGSVGVGRGPGGVRPRGSGRNEVIMGRVRLPLAGLKPTLGKDGEVIQRHWRG